MQLYEIINEKDVKNLIETRAIVYKLIKESKEWDFLNATLHQLDTLLETIYPGWVKHVRGQYGKRY